MPSRFKLPRDSKESNSSIVLQPERACGSSVDRLSVGADEMHQSVKDPGQTHESVESGSRCFSKSMSNIPTNSEKCCFASVPDPEKVNIICLPYAGGDGACYIRWRNLLGGAIAVHPVQLPGRGQRFDEPPCIDLVELSQMILSDLAPFFDVDYAILGTSMGAWIGAELCRSISSLGLPPPLALVVCSAASPHDRGRLPDINQHDNTEVIEKLVRFNPNLSRLITHPELVELAIPMLKADLTACIDWVPKAGVWFDWPIYGFRGEQDTITQASSMKRWRLVTGNRFELWSIDGDHFFVDDPSADFLAQLAALLVE